MDSSTFCKLCYFTTESVKLGLEVEHLRELKRQLEQNVLPNIFDLKADLLTKISKIQHENILLSRAYYYLLYFLFFPDREVPELTRDELCSDILVNSDKFFTTPNYMCAQVMLRVLKSLHSRPLKFAVSLIKSYKAVELNLFAFTTFPALFEFFTTHESVYCAAQFALDLVTKKGPDELIGPIFLSFLFSSFCFTEAYWSNFHRRVCAKKRLFENTIVMEMSVSASQCSPLLPLATVGLIQEVLSKRPELCCSCIVKYLAVTFELWYNYSEEGMSFGCGDAIKEFLEQPTSTNIGNILTIASNMLRREERIRTVPSYTSVVGLSNEHVVFSSIDMATMPKVFVGVADDIPLFDQLKVEEGLGRFTPQAFDYFPNTRKTSSCYDDSRMFLTELATFPMEDNAIFDKAITYKVDLKTHEFEEYALKKSIINSQKEIAELEDYLDIRLKEDAAMELQKTLRRCRAYAFSKKCRQLLQFTPVEPNGACLENTFQEAIGDAFDCQSLFWPFMLELLNYVRMRNPTVAILSRYERIRSEYFKRAWNEVSQLADTTYLIPIVPEPGRRTLTNIGDIVRLIGHIFKELVVISEKLGIESELRHLMKFMFLSSEFPDLMRVFLLLEKEVFSSETFMNLMDETLVSQWNEFFQMIWSTISADDELLRDVTNFRVEALSRRRRQSSA